ncbi:hypothetical protein ANN_19773 [Periplaneta americana]|uniref:Uncharacterized protein n=1 Tax=Periplaneta americana TaxID=6978 RepID=A0ABQ8SBG6_PERAM|nr:hypothetical protein ANN_19773 [Periplaneta americana]
MAGLCEGGNESPGSLKANNSLTPTIKFLLLGEQYRAEQVSRPAGYARGGEGLKAAQGRETCSAEAGCREERQQRQRQEQPPCWFNDCSPRPGPAVNWTVARERGRIPLQHVFMTAGITGAEPARCSFVSTDFVRSINIIPRRM